MWKKLPPEQVELYNRIDEIIWKDWDPIGVSEPEGARDEYYSYLPEVFRLVMEGAPAPTIAKHLHGIATDRMGLESTIEPHLRVAAKLLNLRAKP